MNKRDLTSIDITESLKQLRRSRNITVRDMGKLMNYSYSYISKVENSKEKPSTFFVSAYLKALSYNEREYNELRHKYESSTGISIKYNDSINFLSSETVLDLSRPFNYAENIIFDGSPLTSEDIFILNHIIRAYLKGKDTNSIF